MLNLKEYQLTIFMLPPELHMKHPAVSRISSFLEGALNINFCHLNGEIAEDEILNGEVAQVGDIVFFPDDGKIISLSLLMQDIEEARESTYPMPRVEEDIDFAKGGNILRMYIPECLLSTTQASKIHVRSLPLRKGCSLIALAPLKYADKDMGGATGATVMNNTIMQMCPPEETNLWLQSNPAKLYLYDEAQQEVAQVNMSDTTPMTIAPSFNTIEEYLNWKGEQTVFSPSAFF